MRPPFSAPLALAFAGLILDGQTGSTYKNLEILKGVPDERIPTIMQAFNGFLGVECTHCHVDGKWESSEKPAFARTRQMFHMRAALNSGPLHDYAGIGCWTCHRGQPKPAALPQERLRDPKWPAELALKPDQQSQPAEAVYQNIQVFRGVPAGRFPTVMTLFTVSLGVSCGHCHMEGDWKSDSKPAKETARKMMLMVRSTSKDYFDQSSALSCFTCHRGAVSPERNAPPKA
jgi:hypothetical protein